MRFLHTTTGQFIQADPKDVEYSILSHTWAFDGEQTFQDLRRIQQRYAPNFARRPYEPSEPDRESGSSSLRLGFRKRFRNLLRVKDRFPPRENMSPEPSPLWDDPDLSPKIREACAIARAHGFRFIWIDSCCIDKTSSAELSEAINSMYAWYARADVCYAYLIDVPPQDDHWAEGSRFQRSVWFKRGWTLQELIAPFDVILLSQDWDLIGRKHDLVVLIEKITGIAAEALLHEISLDKFSVAQRLSWASRRQTTRVEDRAYSLLGIFDINMPTVYGEGDRAFRRLQEEIMQRVPDQSLFTAWAMIYGGSEMDPVSPSPQWRQIRCYQQGRLTTSSILSPTPTNFHAADSITAVSHNDICRRLRLSWHLPTPEYTSTPHGIRTHLPMIPLLMYLPQETTVHSYKSPLSEWYLAILGCESASHPGCLLGRVCNVLPSESGVEFLNWGFVEFATSAEEGPAVLNLFPLSSTIERCRSQIELKTVYITHSERTDWTLQVARCRPHETIRLMFPIRVRNTLSAAGYTAELRDPDEEHPTTHILTLSIDELVVTVEYTHSIMGGGRLFTIRGNVAVLRPSGALVNSPSLHWFDRLDPLDSFDMHGSEWKLSLRPQEVSISISNARVVTIQFGLKLMWKSCYSLDVQILSDTVSTTSTPPGEQRGTTQVVQ